MSEKKVKFGIVGLGMIASFHAEAIKNLEGAEFTGAYDPNSQSLNAFAEKYGVNTYQSYQAMLNDDKIDAVCICTPSGFHASQAMEALESEKHVALEKPMAFTAADADKIIDKCKKSGRLLTVISQLRFSEDIRKVKSLAAENAFGKISFCDLYMKYWRAPEYFASSTWKGTKAMDGGGALMNQGIHGVDLLLYIAGNAKLLHAGTKTVFHDIETEDTAAALLEFENGAYGVIEASTCAYPGFERKIEIMGSGGSVIIKENKIEKLIIGNDTVIDNTSGTTSGTASDPAAMSFELHKRQLANFVAAINGEENLLIDAEEGKKAVEMIEQIYNFGR